MDQTIENERTPSLEKKKPIEWEHYNYPPLINIIHFTPAEIPHHCKFIVISLFAVHLATVANCLLNFIDNCIEGGIGILYSLLFLLAFLPLSLLLFYKGLTGLCRKDGSLKIYIILQPVVIAVDIIISIVDFLGFNGFMRVSEMFKEGRGAAGALGLIVSLMFLAMGLFSTFIYVRIVRERATLRANLI